MDITSWEKVAGSEWLAAKRTVYQNNKNPSTYHLTTACLSLIGAKAADDLRKGKKSTRNILMHEKLCVLCMYQSKDDVFIEAEKAITIIKDHTKLLSGVAKDKNYKKIGAHLHRLHILNQTVQKINKETFKFDLNPLQKSIKHTILSLESKLKEKNNLQSTYQSIDDILQKDKRKLRSFIYLNQAVQLAKDTMAGGFFKYQTNNKYTLCTLEWNDPLITTHLQLDDIPQLQIFVNFLFIKGINLSEYNCQNNNYTWLLAIENKHLPILELVDTFFYILSLEEITKDMLLAVKNKEIHQTLQAFWRDNTNMTKSAKEILEITLLLQK